MTSARWEQVQALFLAAADLDAAARDRFVADACGADRALRDDVEALLRAEHRSAGDDLIAGAVGRAAAALAGAAAVSRVGERVGPYRLVREIGHGGMGTVYLAERADEQYQASVAIKFVRPGAGAQELERRFRSERQILAGLTHPNIAWLLDAGTASDGTSYLVMEHVAGESIDRWCDRRGLGLAGRLALFRQVCAGVQYAHQALVVHRDLKPSNILVTADGTPKLVDFGIAKLLAEGVDAEATGTLRLLTPAYGSPEQVRGGRITVATDVYSLGVVLYQLVAGRTPFDFTHASPAEIERRICEEEPAPPSTAAAGPHAAWRRQLAGDLDTIVLKALRKEPERRYGSVEQLAEDLKRHVAGRPVLARPDTLGYRAGKFVRRHRVGVALTAGVVALTGFYTMRLADERDRARQEAAKASAVATFLQSLFEVSDPSESRGATITARELLDRGAQRIDSGLAAQPEVQASMMRLIGNVYGTLGLYAKSRPLVERALARHRALYGDEHAETATSKTALAVLLQDLGDVKAAEPLFRDALDTRRRLFGDEDPGVSEALTNLAFLLETNGDQEGAERLYREALVLNRRIYPPDDPHLASNIAKLGGLLRLMDRLDEAEPLLREALVMQRRAYGNLHPDVASTVRNLAALLRDQEQFQESQGLYREALAMRRAMLGPVHPEVATTLNSYGLLLQRMGETDSAIATFREFIGVLEQIYDGPHPSVAAAYSNLASVLRDAERYDEAAALYRRSMTVQDQVLAAGHPNRAHPRIGLAGVYLDQRRFARAEPLIREALSLRRGALPAGHRYIGEALTDLGTCLTGQGRYREAEAALLEAHQVLLEGQGADDSRTQRAGRRLVTLYEVWGRPADAARYRPHPTADSVRAVRGVPPGGA